MSIPTLFISTPFIIGYICLAILFLTQIFYYLYYYNQIPKRLEKDKSTDTPVLPAVSVIICVENQVDELRKNIAGIMEQDYPSYEVIIVDMASNDETKEYLEYLETQYTNLYFSFIPQSARFISKRKLAQTIGAKASKTDWLVFTDIDCKPTSNQWLKGMLSAAKEETQIILGYSHYSKEETRFNRFISYDNQLLHMRFMGFALRGMPYIGIGRNLAYKKELFFRDRKAFYNQLNLQRGEDYLFVNQYATKENTAVVVAPETIVEIKPLERTKAWRELKRSHLLSVKRLSGSKQYLAGLETTTRLLFYTLSLALFIFSLTQMAWLISVATLLLFSIRWVIQLTITNRVAKKMNEDRKYSFSLLVLDITLPLKSLLLRLRLPKKRKGDIIDFS